MLGQVSPKKFLEIFNHHDPLIRPGQVWLRHAWKRMLASWSCHHHHPLDLMVVILMGTLDDGWIRDGWDESNEGCAYC